jgi:predicted nucleic-acid-binding Zn-ribbon protein
MEEDSEMRTESELNTQGNEVVEGQDIAIGTQSIEGESAFAPQENEFRLRLNQACEYSEVYPTSHSEQTNRNIIQVE